MTGQTFSPDVVAAICRHMNDDHPDDALLICRTLGGQPDAARVRTVGVDGQALHLQAEVAGRPVPVCVAFATPVQEWAEVRQAVVELQARACAQMGIPAPGEHD